MILPLLICPRALELSSLGSFEPRSNCPREAARPQRMKATEATKASRKTLATLSSNILQLSLANLLFSKNFGTHCMSRVFWLSASGDLPGDQAC